MPRFRITNPTTGITVDSNATQIDRSKVLDLALRMSAEVQAFTYNKRQDDMTITDMVYGHALAINGLSEPFPETAGSLLMLYHRDSIEPELQRWVFDELVGNGGITQPITLDHAVELMCLGSAAGCGSSMMMRRSELLLQPKKASSAIWCLHKTLTVATAQLALALSMPHDRRTIPDYAEIGGMTYINGMYDTDRLSRQTNIPPIAFTMRAFYPGFYDTLQRDMSSTAGNSWVMRQAGIIFKLCSCLYTLQKLAIRAGANQLAGGITIGPRPFTGGALIEDPVMAFHTTHEGHPVLYPVARDELAPFNMVTTTRDGFGIEMPVAQRYADTACTLDPSTNMYYRNDEGQTITENIFGQDPFQQPRHGEWRATRFNGTPVFFSQRVTRAAPWGRVDIQHNTCPSCGNWVAPGEGGTHTFRSGERTVTCCPSCVHSTIICDAHGHMGSRPCPACEVVRRELQQLAHDFTGEVVLSKKKQLLQGVIEFMPVEDNNGVIHEDDPSGRFLPLTMGIEFETGTIADALWKKKASEYLKIPGWTCHVDPSLGTSFAMGYDMNGNKRNFMFRGWEVVTPVLSGKMIERAIDEFYGIADILPEKSCFKVEDALAGNHMHVGFDFFYKKMEDLMRKAQTTNAKPEWDAYHGEWGGFLTWGKNAVRIVRQFVSKRRRAYQYCNGDLSYREKHGWNKVAPWLRYAMENRSISDSSYPRYAAISLSGATAEFRIWPSSDNIEFVKARAELSQKLVEFFRVNGAQAGEMLSSLCPTKTYIQRGRLVERLARTLGLNIRTCEALDMIHHRYYRKTYIRYDEWVTSHTPNAPVPEPPPDEQPNEIQVNGTASRAVVEAVDMDDEVGPDLATRLIDRFGNTFNQSNVVLTDTHVLIENDTIITDHSRRDHPREQRALVYLNESTLEPEGVGSNFRIQSAF